MVVCLERGADLHMAQRIPLPLTVSCFSKIQLGLPFWYWLTRIVCLEQGADLHMAQLMPLPLTVTVCCFSKIPALPGSHGKRAIKWVCVCVCNCHDQGHVGSKIQQNC